MPKIAPGCKIRGNPLRGGSIICFRFPFSDTLHRTPRLGSSRVGTGIVGEANPSSAVPTPLDRFP